MNNLNLQFRLCIILFTFCVITMTGVLIRAVVIADELVSEEVASATNLVDRLFNIAKINDDSPFNPESEPAFLQELIALENIRHIDVFLESDNIDYPQLNRADPGSIDAPAWFVALAYPDEETLIRSFRQGNGDLIMIYADPSDEIAEIWAETRARLITIVFFMLALGATLVLLIYNWMRPLEAIAGVLDNVEEGDFSRRIPTFGLPEIRRIGDRINHLTTWLGSSKVENERLTRKSVTVQEQERRFLAQELHDSLGQAVSAIKAIAVSIEERLRQNDPTSAASARNIEEIADSAYSSVRKLMTSLRPSVLDELGLVEGLRQMTDDWNVHHEDAFCRLRFEGDFANLEEEQEINIYRIVQEALTNISKYASAENVSVTLSGNEIITLNIVDDGVGFLVKEVSESMGLSGIRDRVTLLRGQFDIASKPGKGVSIHIEFPRRNNFRRRAGDRRAS